MHVNFFLIILVIYRTGQIACPKISSTMHLLAIYLLEAFLAKHFSIKGNGGGVVDSKGRGIVVEGILSYI